MGLVNVYCYSPRIQTTPVQQYLPYSTQMPWLRTLNSQLITTDAITYDNCLGYIVTETAQHLYEIFLHFYITANLISAYLSCEWLHLLIKVHKIYGHFIRLARPREFELIISYVKYVREAQGNSHTSPIPGYDQEPNIYIVSSIYAYITHTWRPVFQLPTNM